jgi:hypothetical protein
MARRTGSSVSGDVGAAESDGGSIIDPKQIDEEIVAEPGNDEPRSGSGSTGPKRRGRRPGSTKAKASLDLKGIEHVLVSTHFMLAAALRVPELQLSQTEGAAMANAIANVARHYPVIAATQQTLDWIALISVLIVTYGTRMAAYKARQTKQQNERRINVVSPAFRPPEGMPQGSA